LIINKNEKTKIDWLIVGFVVILMAISLIVLCSATSRMMSLGGMTNYWLKQCVWLLCGFGAMLYFAHIDIRKIGKASYALYIINIVLLILVLIIGKKISGSQRWLQLGPMTIQPSEFMKMVYVIFMAWYLHQIKHQKWTLGKIMKTGFFTLIPMLLIVKEPDLGTTLVFVPIYLSMIFIAGAPIRYFVYLGLGAVLSSPLGWMLLKGYQKKRIFIFLNPYDDQFGAGWPIIQSKIAIGSGRFWGKGFLQGTQTQLDFLPERHTDFILG